MKKNVTKNTSKDTNNTNINSYFEFKYHEMIPIQLFD